MTNKDLINLLSGFSMKSEVEVIQDEKTYIVDKAIRVYIPETRTDKGTKVAARNIVQITLKEK